MKQLLILCAVVFILSFFLLVLQNAPSYHVVSPLSTNSWKVESIDTMKYSRDPAREKLSDPSFDAVIDNQMENIAKTGANYVAIGTPYDTEFLPYLARWVTLARKHNLHVWFRGNFSGWEEWFGYSKITRATHIAKTRAFILANANLFENGDIFTSCPECENGANVAMGDQIAVKQYRSFLIVEYQTTKDAFQTINKHVVSNYYSMNGDMARLVMDRQTTQALDGIVVVDHYVKSPDVLANDLRSLAEKSGGQIVLGEFGAPIPDIHGAMSDEEQKQWIQQVLEKVAQVPQVIGVNYWVNTGGSTELWDASGKPKSAVEVLTTFYSGRKPQ